MLISVIICTRDRADDLRETLRSLGGVQVPQGMQCELIAVDNGSTDETRAVIEGANLPNMTARYVLEPRAGQVHARNHGLAAAQGEIILFTDDDLRFPEDWIEAMAGPLLRNEAQGVAGGVRLAPHLVRPWMNQVHRYWLAEFLPAGGPSGHMIGANMGFRREVLEKVPAFDPELGPGALGFGDDTLFSFQLVEAGYKLLAIPDAVEHHLQTSRLGRANFLSHAKKLGMSGAYHDYHWEHADIRFPHLRLIKKALELGAWRRSHPELTSQTEGMDEVEMGHLRSVLSLPAHSPGAAQAPQLRAAWLG